MTIEEAILSALHCEHRVRDHYQGAAGNTSEPKAKGFFELMALEEQGHVEYLEAKLAQWGDEGKIRKEVISTAVAGRSVPQEDAADFCQDTRNYAAVAEYLYGALKLEQEVTELYRKLIDAVDHADSETMFRRFLEIEDGHTAVVQAEIDVVARTGYFFDFQEFNMEG